jgi:hypothetical protein
MGWANAFPRPEWIPRGRTRSAWAWPVESGFIRKRHEAILLRWWQAEEIVKTPFPRASRIRLKAKDSIKGDDLPRHRNSSCLVSLLDRCHKFQQVRVDFIQVCGRQAVSYTRIADFLRSFGSPDVDWFAAEQAVYASLIASGTINPCPNDPQNFGEKIYRPQDGLEM